MLRDPRRLRSLSLEERFWASVIKGGPNECWPWKFGLYPYGQLNHEPAHRVSWRLHYGPIPEGQVVRHRCHNKACVNPRHLRAGTQKQNIHDTTQIKRHAWGERHGRRKLTAKSVLAIRRLASKGTDVHTLADRFGVQRVQIARIVRRERWKHLEDAA